ncbi:hypothetical protein [uncultured Cohaesibacter sp.]|uniref:hypothetical protein n=1 Tax=uncultured Cohaesibacter sp. TaxID=1002546 RepID=UPI0029C93C02|nr:hypothetical protein [uncultured Cohaesibacter sp.]
MSHLQNPKAIESPQWFKKLSRGDIVLFTLPAPYLNLLPPHAPSTFLVLEVSHVDKDMLVVLAIGHPIVSEVLRPFDIPIIDKLWLKEAGLNAPVSFNTNDRIIVPVRHPGFDLNSGGTPVIGKLNPASQYCLRFIRSPQRVLIDQHTCYWAKHWLNRKSHSGADDRERIIIPAPYTRHEGSAPRGGAVSPDTAS